MEEFWQEFSDFFTLTPENWWIQGIGYVGLIFVILVFQTRSHTKIMVFRSACELCYALQYLFLNSYTAFGLNLIGPIRNLIFEICIKKGKSTLIPQIGFSAFMVIYTIFTWQGWISLVVMTAKVLTTVAFGIKDTKTVRRIAFPADCMWLAHSLYVRSAAGLIGDVIGISSLIVAIIRLDIIKDKKHELPTQ